MLEPKLIKPAEGQDVLARVQCCANMALWLPDGPEFSQSYSLPKPIYIYQYKYIFPKFPTIRTVMEETLLLILCLVNTRSIKRSKGNNPATSSSVLDSYHGQGGLGAAVG